MIEFDTNPSTGEVGWENQGTTTTPKPKIVSIEIIDKTDTTIKVKVTTKRNVGGTLIYSIQENGAYQEVERVTQTATGEPAQEEYTFNNLDSSKIYSKIKVEAIAENGEKASEEINVIDIPALTRNDVIFTVNGKNIEEIDYTKGPIMVKIATKNVDVTGYKLQYATGDPKVESNWKEYKTTGVEFTSNGNLYVRLSDGRTGGKYVTGSVTKIDKEAPTGLNLTVTDSGIDSITVTSSATDAGSGVARYYFSKDNGITWEPKDGISATNGKEASYTFADLIQYKTYQLKMKAVDNVENESETEEAKAQAPTKLEIGFQYNPAEDWTNEKVTVTITPEAKIQELIGKGYTIEYSKDKNIWNTYDATKGIITEEYGEIYVKVKNKKGHSITGEEPLGTVANVTNIDTEPPKDFTITQKRATTSTITVEAIAEDADKTATSGKSGIQGYRFAISKDGGKSWIEYPETKGEYQESGTYQFTDLIGDVAGVTYKIKVEAKDKAGNTKEVATECSTIRNDAYYVEKKDTLLCTVDKREYKKTNDGSAIICLAYVKGSGQNNLIPFLLSTSKAAVSYTPDSDNQEKASGGEVDYKGTRFYFSAAAHWMRRRYIRDEISLYKQYAKYV